MNEQELSAGLRVFLQERTRLPDVSSVHQQVLATPIEEMPQQRGWLPTFPRLQSMFSATKFVVAGAIVALFGGFLLIGQPFDQQESAVPGAATDGASTAMSTFTVLEGDDGFLGDWGLGPVSVTDEGLLLEEGSVQFGAIWASDPRISGETVITYNSFLIDELIDEEHGIRESWVSVGKMIIANAGGRWIETDMGHFEGVDGYAGLTAVLEDGAGVIFRGDMPPTPKDWCQLAREDFAAATSRVPDDEHEIGVVKDWTRRLCPSVEMP